MKKKFAVAAATAALITASFTMSVFANDKSADTPKEANDAGDITSVAIDHKPDGDYLTGADAGDTDAGFIKIGGTVYYVDGTSKKLTATTANVTGVFGSTYYKDGKKVTAKDIITVDGKTYLVEADSSIKKPVSTPVLKVTGHTVGNVTYTYLIDKDGAVIDGWTEIDGKWYYAVPNGKEVVEEKWVQTTPGRWFYVGKNGEMVSGKNYEYTANVLTDNTVDQLDATDKTATITDANGKKYVVDENGLWLNGWYKKSNGTWNFYSDVETGWVKYGTKWVYITSYVAKQNEIFGDYAFGADCYMITGLGSVTNVGYSGNVYADANGKLQSGFQKVNGVEYYFAKADQTGSPAAGTVANDKKYLSKEGSRNDGKAFFTDKTGKVILNQWYKDKDGDWAYVDKDGKPVVNGPAIINGSTYYFQNSKMISANACKYTIAADGAWTLDPATSLISATATAKAAALVNTVVIDNTGRQINNGWADLGNGDWAYAKDGKAYDGWLLYNGSWYYIDCGKMVRNNYVGNYFLDANGVWTATR